MSSGSRYQWNADWNSEREPRQGVARQDAGHRGHRDRDLVEAKQVRGDAACAEVVVLPQVADLADHLTRRRARRAMRRPRTIAQADIPVLSAATFLFIERLAGYRTTCGKSRSAGTRGRRFLRRLPAVTPSAAR